LLRPSTDSSYLDYQYGTSEKLQIRIETHGRYTEAGEDFTATEPGHIDAQPGLCILDVGCGPGRLVGALRDSGLEYIGLDRSGSCGRRSLSCR